MKRYVCWNYPLSRAHAGIMLGNGTMGVLVWGQANVLKLTIGRADLWDHRGGMPTWNSRQNFKNIRSLLERKDAKALKNIFSSSSENISGLPPRPSVIPVGRFDIILEENSKLLRAKLDTRTGHVAIVYSLHGKEMELSIATSMDSDVCLVCLPKTATAKIEAVPCWNYLGEYLKSISFKSPTHISESKVSGWFQALPVDPGICAACFHEASSLWIATGRDTDGEKAKIKTRELISTHASLGTKAFLKHTHTWWSAYWKDIPSVSMPNKVLAELYAYGLYKFAAFTNAIGTPATLQGPWIEEDVMPPWSSDYHFNINVQMCYWPAFKANRLSHLMPMFKMVWSWRETLKANAKAFVGIDDGLMLPHAVDSRCTCMGAFWSGTIDHACSAWIAQLMCTYYRYTLDIAFLREIAFPFMWGVMRVYEEMIEKDGENYSLPVTVSPEYRGDSINAWGKNASFQLAAVHRLLTDLEETSILLGEKLPPVWRDIHRKLPEVTLIGDQGEERLALWENTDLEESHRHHSHIASICPFETIDPMSKKWSAIVSRTINHWTSKGMGLWAGWSLPWASMIYSRLNNGAMAELLLEIWEKVFTNEGHGTLHDACISGFSAIAYGEGREIMQMEAGMGALTAIQDMLMHSRQGVVYIFPGVSQMWKECSFSRMPCEGGFLISAERTNYATCKVVVESRFGGVVRLHNPWDQESVNISVSRSSRNASGEVLAIELKAGAKACITRYSSSVKEGVLI